MMMSVAPASAAAASATPFVSSTNWAARASGVSAPAAISPCAALHSQSASGCRPASRAVWALVLRFCL